MRAPELKDTAVPRVSIIIPTYNRADMVVEAISSVLSQTERDVEVLVVDDGSTDDTRSAVAALGDARVRYFYKDNGGPAAARNYGLAKVTGQYLAFLDSDDLWPQTYLDTMISRLERRPECGAAYSPITVAYPDGCRVVSYERPAGKSGRITTELFKHSFIWPSASLFRASVWRGFFFDEQLNRISEDSDAFLRLSLSVEFLFVSEVEAIHRLSSDSISAAHGRSPMRLLSLERFYFNLGGDRVIPSRVALRRLSHTCRALAEDRRKANAREAALSWYRRAISYWPYDLRLYPGWLSMLLRSNRDDGEPEWTIPAALRDPVGPDGREQA